jgi:hypothetical protein
MKIIEKFRTRLLRSMLAKEGAYKSVGRKAIDLDSAHSIGILFDATDLQERETVLDFAENLKKEGKRVKLLAYFKNSMKSENFTFPHIDRRYLDWARRPQSREAADFSQEPFDVLLNLTHESWTPLDFIAARSKAKFRVGPYTESIPCYDLMIDLPGQRDLKAFMQQVVFYLKKMRPVKEVVAV